jgi:signal transduction histidine kinase
MEREIVRSCAEALSFFGKTNRLISHELKNVLAIISETLGLIDELMELSETGMELKPGKLRSLSESIVEETERANAIIRNMNTFAHSVDELISDVDVGQAITLVIALSRLDSALRSTKVRLAESDPCVIYTVPIFFENLLYHVLDHSLRGAGPDKEIQISFDCDESEVKIIFSGIASHTTNEFPTKRQDLLAGILSAEVLGDPAAGEMVVVLPKRIDETGIKNLVTGP